MRTGYVPQHLEFDKEMPVTVEDFLAASLTRRPVWTGVGKKTRAQVMEALKMVEGEKLLHRPLGRCSGGELQRVLLALALHPAPDLLVLDEPVSGVDQNGLQMFLDTVVRLKEHHHMAILLVSHDLNVVRQYADHVVLLDKTVLKQGKPDDVFASPEFQKVFGLGAKTLNAQRLHGAERWMGRKAGNARGGNRPRRRRGGRRDERRPGVMDAIRAFVQTLLPFEFMQFDFMVNALLAILLLTPLLGLLGTMAVNQQMAFFSDALGHSALTGIGLGILLGVSSDLLAMLVFGIVWALLICRIKQTGAASTDTIISVFSSTSVAAGVLVLSMGGGFAKYSSLLVGDVLAVQDSDLLYLLIALVAGIALWAVLYNSLLLSGISPSLARSRGIHNRLGGVQRS